MSSCQLIIYKMEPGNPYNYACVTEYVLDIFKCWVQFTFITKSPFEECAYAVYITAKIPVKYKNIVSFTLSY